MRLAVTHLLLLISLTGFTQVDQQTKDGAVNVEYATLQVKQAVSGPNIVVDLFVDESDEYLGMRVENVNHKGFKVTGKDGKITMVHNEMEALNFLAKLGWRIQHVYTYKANGNMLIRYLMVKQR